MTSSTDTNMITLAETQEELRAMQALKRVIESIPLHRRADAFRDLVRQFPDFRINYDGETVKIERVKQ